MGQSEVVAAGAVLTRKGRRGHEVLLIHRPRYDDWSFPKGKVDPGEHVLAAAVREVEEETTLRATLGPALGRQRYRVADRRKVVHYWSARAVGDDDVSGWVPNGEVDEVAWMPWDKAARLLTYRYDRRTLKRAARRRRRSHALVVLRHASAERRASWSGDDHRRPLAGEGREQAAGLVPLLSAYGVSRLVTSSSLRCAQTLEPYAVACGRPLEERDVLSEEGASKRDVRQLVEELRRGNEGAVLCTHRPVLPLVFDALGVSSERLEPAELVVVHHRKSRVLAVERHHPRPS